MKSDRWWIRGLPLRRLKRYIRSRNHNPRCAFYHDGVCFSVKDWGEALDEARSLKPGDPIWNPYKSDWDTIAGVEFEWAPVQRLLSRTSYLDGGPERLGRRVGSFINYFHIDTASGYSVYDTPSWMREWCPESRQATPPNPEGESP